MLRSTTNLVVPENLQLPKTELKRGFLYVYNKGYKGLEPVFMNQLWLSVVVPEIVADKSFGKDRKMVRAFALHAEKNLKAGYLRLKKVNDPEDPHFVVAVPVAEFSRYGFSAYVSRLRTWFGSGDHDYEIPESAQRLADALSSTAEAREVQQQVIPAAKVLQAMPHLDAKEKAELEKTLLAVRLQYAGSEAVIFLDFKISKEVAQQLTTTEWMMIRNMDLYPLLLQWQTSIWGFRESPPLASFPMSKISKTLPPVEEGQARVNENGLAVSYEGAPMWLPAKLDNTSRYEDLFAQVGDKGDDTFGLLDVKSVSDLIAEGHEIKVHLPANVPVLIDWVNNKYAYTLSSGVLKVQDLSRFKAVDAAHANNLLRNWSLGEKQLQHIVNMAHASGIKDELFFTQEEAQALEENDPVVAAKLTASGGTPVMPYWKLAESYFKRFVADNVVLKDISIEGDPIFRPLARFMDAAHAAIVANMDAVNMKYSVSGVSATLGIVTLLAKYANDYSNVVTRSNAICKAAQSQKVDPQWNPPSTPLLMQNPDRPFSVLPHQRKVMNLMKDSPDFAILPVQAGGGKTPLAILDILTELKASRSQPYLVLCPSTLVAQYVKEVTYFTSGKLNVIPINTDSIFRNGVERLTALIATAPRNSIVVADYDVLRQKAYDVCYGTTSVTIYPVIEFLRQFNFGYVLCDEAHYLKNDSQRTRAAMVLIADIPKKRLASGTMAHDSPSDLALQIAMLDPSLFGSRNAFNERFGLVVKGDRVITWKPGAQTQIMDMIKSRIVVAKAMRKEWAALLPSQEENIYATPLSDAQRQVYDAILTEALERLKADMKNNPAVAKFFKNEPTMLENPQRKGDQGLDEEADEEAEDAADEEAGEDLAALLGFYLARLEQFLTAPGRDELGVRLLKGDDLLSPKAKVIVDIVKSHIDQGLEGKVLIFTNYTASAEEIYNAFPPELQAQGILYVAADKVEAGAAFEKNPNKKWMVGVENSMNTGLNFQHVSRLIRVETVWNPGTLEQGNSRVNRPELKQEDRREKIYYDWVVASGTVDVTKISRLTSKIIAVAKFENTDNPAYAEIPDVPVIPMTQDAIFKFNTTEDLRHHAEALAMYKTIQKADYAEYREKHGKLVMTRLAIADDPKDAMIMPEVPYTPGLELFKSGELGLVRVDEFLRQDDIAGAPDEDNGSADEPESNDPDAMTPDQKQKAKLYAALVGQTVHTEFGDGVVKSLAPKRRRLNVVLPNGYMVRVRMAAAFVVTEKASRDAVMREQLMTAVSDSMPIAPKVDVASPILRVDNVGMRKAEKLRQDQEKEAKRKAAERVKEALSVELLFNVSNGFLGITFFSEGHDNAAKALQALGFRPIEPYVYAEMKTAQQLIKQFNAWNAEGFTFDKQFLKLGAVEAIKDLAEVLKSGKLASGTMNYKFSSRNQLDNFFRLELKPTLSKTEFKPYPMIEDGRAYIVMHTRGQPATMKAIQVKAPGVRWNHSPESLVYYGLDIDNIGRTLKEIQAAGIQIANIQELDTDFKKLKKVKIRNPEV